ncbi:MAG: hypothetical protein D6725_06530 [Planctomycetota bacterium]|nr:MAG: hypothetical protein D6725_06530 [Planctomycetota bacterium]
MQTRECDVPTGRVGTRPHSKRNLQRRAADAFLFAVHARVCSSLEMPGAMIRFFRSAAFVAAASMACCAALVLLAAPSPVSAAPPVVTSIQPRAWTIGTTQRVTVRGKNLQGATRLLVLGDAEARLADGVANNGQAADHVVFDVQVPTDAVAGPIVVAVVGPRGASPPALVVLDRLAVVTQSADNTQLPKAQSIPAGSCVSGVVGNLSRHYFKFAGKAGQKMAFEVVARRLGSALDPLLRIFDAGGHEVTYADDTQGLSGDCRFLVTLPADGEYFVELRDIRYQGGPQHFFVLRVGDFPVAFVPQPLGVPAEQTTTVRFAGEPELLPAVVRATDRWGIWLPVSAKRGEQTPSATAYVAVGRVPELVEHEPNDTSETAQLVPLDVGVSGTLAEPGDRDTFAFAGAKGTVVRIDAAAREAHLPTLLHLQLVDGSGKVLAAVEDIGVTKPTLRATLPADGTYRVIVGDLRGEGSVMHGYRLRIARSRPEVRLDAAVVSANVAPGTLTAIPVQIDRVGYSGALRLRAVDLPSGFAGAATLVAPGVAASAVTIEAKSPPAGTAGAFRIVAEPIDGSAKVPVATTALRGWQDVTGLKWPVPAVTHVQYVAAGEPQPFALEVSDREVTVGQRLSRNVTLRARRDEKFDAPITMALVPEKGGLPSGLTIKAASFAKGKSEATVTISATDKTPSGRYTVILAAVQKAKNRTTVLQAAPPITVTVRPTLRLQARIDRPQLKPGEKAVVHVELDRSPGLTGPLQVELVGLPKGVKAVRRMVPPEASAVDLPVEVAADAPAAAATRLRVRATVSIGKNNVAIEADGPTLAVVR